jgi:hypothetical protein
MVHAMYVGGGGELSESENDTTSSCTLWKSNRFYSSSPKTHRYYHSIEVGRNVCHGSDAVDSAEKEIAHWFPEGVCAWDSCEQSWVYE